MPSRSQIVLERFNSDLASNPLTIEEHRELEPFHTSNTVSVIEAKVLFAQFDLKFAELCSCLVLVHLIVHGFILAWLSLAVREVKVVP